MTDQNHQIKWYRCSRHGRELKRSCPECRAVTGFTEPEWDYRVAKENGVVLPLPLCPFHGNVMPGCPACVPQPASGPKAGGT